MREKKSKGKRVVDGKWVYGFYWFVEEHENPNLSKKHFIKSLNNGVDFEVTPETVGDFTGEKDRCGQEVYEGDILKGTDGDFEGGYFTYTGIVKWDEETLQFIVEDVENFPLYDYSFDTIIGNIHDKNPENIGGDVDAFIQRNRPD